MPKKQNYYSPKSNQRGKKPHLPRPLSLPAIGALFCQVRADVHRVLALYPRPATEYQRVERRREMAAILGARLQRLALVNGASPPSPKEPGVPPIWCIEDFHFRVRKLAGDFLELLHDTDKMNPAARLKYLRRRLGNLGRKFELYSNAKVIDRPAFVRPWVKCPPAEQKLSRVDATGLAAGESGNSVDMPKPKVVSIKESGRKVIAVDERANRFILNVGPDRVAFDFSVSATRLAPKTGDRPAPVLPMNTRKPDEVG